ncbi:MAG TPA: cellulase N-terminal Ig-like domain-containing protein [Streptosporangiaceae bacterium]|jgi:hypothetical protein|nr:cellulase N-terminal Ig-like domain-containing protein [Streptosporangiaceae bacterium]
MNASWTRKATGGVAVAATLSLGLALAAVGAGAPKAAAAASVPAQVRVNQAGYAQDATKEAIAMLPAAAGKVSFTVADGGHVVFRGTAR